MKQEHTMGYSIVLFVYIPIIIDNKNLYFIVCFD